MSADPAPAVEALMALVAKAEASAVSTGRIGQYTRDIYDAAAALTAPAPDLVAAVEALPGRWVAERGYPGDHHGIDYVDRDAVLALLGAAPRREVDYSDLVGNGNIAALDAPAPNLLAAVEARQALTDEIRRLPDIADRLALITRLQEYETGLRAAPSREGE